MSTDTDHLDRVIAAARAGGALRVDKPKPVAPPSPIVGDPERPASAAVNAEVEMTYAEAQRRLAARDELVKLLAKRQPGKVDRARIAELQKIALTKDTLTEAGWVLVPKTTKAKDAR